MHGPAHVWFIPADINPRDIEWAPVKNIKRLHPDEIRRMHAKWERWKSRLDRLWLLDAEQKLAEVAKVIEADKRAQLLADLQAAAMADNLRDAAENARIGKQFTDAYFEVERRIRMKAHRKKAAKLRNSDRAAGLAAAREKLERLGKPVHREVSI